MPEAATRMMPLGHETCVRSWLAAATDGQHQGLHRHPLLGQMLSPHLESAQYNGFLRSQLPVFQWVETWRAELGEWPEFSLASAVSALKADLGTQGLVPRLRGLPGLDNPAQLIGALYATHGSAFGGNVMRRSVERTLPDAPRAFLSCGTSAPTWRLLLRTLEQSGRDPGRARHVLTGASLVFDAVRRTADLELARTSGNRVPFRPS